MTLQYSPKNNPRVIIIQKLYGKFFNKDEDLTFPKHRFKKFIKDVVNGTIERDDIINEEIKNHLNSDVNLKNLDKVFQIIIKEYLNASNFFIEEAQTKYLNALLDKISKKLRNSNE